MRTTRHYRRGKSRRAMAGIASIEFAILLLSRDPNPSLILRRNSGDARTPISLHAQAACSWLATISLLCETYLAKKGRI